MSEEKKVLGTRNVWSLAVAALLVILLFTYTVTYTVPAGQVGVVLTFGAIKDGGIQRDPGLYMKWPWPFQTHILIDERVRLFEDPGQEVTTKDKFNIHASLVVGWRVTDPKVYLEKLQNESRAETTIRARVNSERENAIKSITLDTLLTTDPGHRVAYRKFEDDMRDNIQKSLREADFGVEATFLAVKYLRFPKSVTETIQARMSAERRRAAQVFQSAGDNEANQIRIRAQAQSDKAIADATGTAIKLRGSAVADVAETYDVFARNSALADALNAIDLLNTAVGEGTTLILSTDQLTALRAFPEENR